MPVYPINKSIKADIDETWIFSFTFYTFDQRGYGSVPFNLASRFITMEVKEVASGTIIASAYADPVSTSALVDAVKGKAVIAFPMSATSGIVAGFYDYSVYVLDNPYRISATYVKKMLEGGLAVQ